MCRIVKKPSSSQLFKQLKNELKRDSHKRTNFNLQMQFVNMQF